MTVPRKPACSKSAKSSVNSAFFALTPIVAKNLHALVATILRGLPTNSRGFPVRIGTQPGFRFRGVKADRKRPPACKVSNPSSTNLHMNQKPQLGLENKESLSVQIIPIDLQDWLESRSATDIPVRFMANSDRDSARALNRIAYSPLND
jgi:hypothetical protein